MTWIITGGAGYIGAHVVRAMRGRGHSCVVVDDLSTGLPHRVAEGVSLIRMDVSDRDRLTEVMREHGAQGVVHLAAKKSPAESVADPLKYYRENVGGFQSVLSAAVTVGLRHVVLSSSCSVYGNPAAEFVAEDAPYAPINPYGTTKVICEMMLADVTAAHDINGTSLRYFNVAGAGEPELGDVGIFNLIPLALRAVTSGARPKVFGADYPTRDGSGVRDYIHVVDLADAHALAAERLAAGEADGVEVFNIGRGEGISVLEVLAAVRDVTGIEIEPEVVQRRAGDPASVVGDVRLSAQRLRWRAERDLRQMVESAWLAWGSTPGTAGSLATGTSSPDARDATRQDHA